MHIDDGWFVAVLDTALEMRAIDAIHDAGWGVAERVEITERRQVEGAVGGAFHPKPDIKLELVKRSVNDPKRTFR